MSGRNTSQRMRVLHRYLGFFLTGIMTVYALSGMTLIFRNTDFMKRTSVTEKTIATGLTPEEAGRELNIRNFRMESQEGSIYRFREGEYDAATGKARLISKVYRPVIGKMISMHKAKSGEPLFFLNVFFGASLLFFVISAFWMYLPGSGIFRKGIYFALAGAVLTLLMVFL